MKNQHRAILITVRIGDQIEEDGSVKWVNATKHQFLLTGEQLDGFDADNEDWLAGFVGGALMMMGKDEKSA